MPSVMDEESGPRREHVHRYPPGFTAGLYANGPWVASDDFDAWRFCPVCGAALKVSDFVLEAPYCTTCNREFMYCPCACVEEGVNVSGRSQTEPIRTTTELADYGSLKS